MFPITSSHLEGTRHSRYWDIRRHITYLDRMVNACCSQMSSRSTALCSFKQEAMTYPIEIASQLLGEASCEVKNRSLLEKEPSSLGQGHLNTRIKLC